MRFGIGWRYGPFYVTSGGRRYRRHKLTTRGQVTVFLIALVALVASLIYLHVTGGFNYLSK